MFNFRIHCFLATNQITSRFGSRQGLRQRSVSREALGSRMPPSKTKDLDVKNEMSEEISSENTEEEIPDIVLSPVVEKTSDEVKI